MPELNLPTFWRWALRLLRIDFTSDFNGSIPITRFPVGGRSRVSGCLGLGGCFAAGVLGGSRVGHWPPRPRSWSRQVVDPPPPRADPRRKCRAAHRRSIVCRRSRGQPVGLRPEPVPRPWHRRRAGWRLFFCSRRQPAHRHHNRQASRWWPGKGSESGEDRRVVASWFLVRGSERGIDDRYDRRPWFRLCGAMPGEATGGEGAEGRRIATTPTHTRPCHGFPPRHLYLRFPNPL